MTPRELFTLALLQLAPSFAVASAHVSRPGAERLLAVDTLRNAAQVSAGIEQAVIRAGNDALAELARLQTMTAGARSRAQLRFESPRYFQRAPQRDARFFDAMAASLRAIAHHFRSTHHASYRWAAPVLTLGVRG